jgi:hypothetical protein
MSKHIKLEPISKFCETHYFVGPHIDRELSNYLSALAEALEMNEATFTVISEPLDDLGAELRRLQRHNRERKAYRELSAVHII